MGSIAKGTDQSMDALRQWVGQNMRKIEAAVPSHVRPNTIVRTLFNALEANPDLARKCKPASIGKCLIRAATYGLEINSGQLGHCYLVPYGDEAQLQLSYKGIKELVRRSGEGMVFMGEVRAGDRFCDNGQDEKPTHTKADDANRHEQPLTHAYAYMKFTNGFFVSKVMSRNECLSHRDRYAKAWIASKKKDSPWHEENDAFPKMCQKTCVHALANDGDLPLSADLRDALQTIEGEAYEGAAVVDAVPAKQIAADPGEIPVEMTDAELIDAFRECDTPQQAERLRDHYAALYADNVDIIAEIADDRIMQLEIIGSEG